VANILELDEIGPVAGLLARGDVGSLLHRRKPASGATAWSVRMTLNSNSNVLQGGLGSNLDLQTGVAARRSPLKTVQSTVLINQSGRSVLSAHY